MKLKMFQIDAFAEQVFEGNPAAVCPLDSWLPDNLLQAIAVENNLSETAFFVPANDGYELRWFTPAHEVDLCGHATLASAYVLFEHLQCSLPEIRFHTRSGVLVVTKKGEDFCMTFPATRPQACETPDALAAGLRKMPLQTLAGFDYVAVYESEDDIRALTPDYTQLEMLDLRGVIATAPGNDVDFVSRFFAPKFGIKEDPVTGSAHCELAPYWAAKLGKTKLNARQLSPRGGTLKCELVDDRVVLIGRAVQFMTAEITIPESGSQ